MSNPELLPSNNSKYGAGSLLVHRHSDWPVMAKLWMTDLFWIALFINDSYSG